MTSTWVIENKIFTNNNKLYKDNGNGTGTLLVPVNTVVPFSVLITCCLFSIMTGAIIAGAIIDWNSFGSKAISPIEYTSSELKAYSLIDKTVETEIRLKIVPIEEIQRLGDKNAYALAYYNKPCTILIPTNMKIQVYPSLKKAEWVNVWDGNTLAHEILHCIRGPWHGNSK